MKHILIDSDVILDVLFEREPFVKEGQIILSECLKEKIKGYVTLITLANINYMATKVIGAQNALNFIKEIERFLHVLPANNKIAQEALYSNFKDFEDALQNFSAVFKNDVNYIITRNTKDYKNSDLNVLTPSEFLKLNP